MAPTRFINAQLIGLGLSLLSGCANLGEHTAENKKPESFAIYAEDVFRRQNNATSRIMTLMPEDLSDERQYDALLNAEKKMDNACEPLNDYARRTQNGEDVNVLTRSRVGVSIKNCEHATLIVETMLNNIDCFITTAARSNPK